MNSIPVNSYLNIWSPVPNRLVADKYELYANGRLLVHLHLHIIVFA